MVDNVLDWVTTASWNIPGWRQENPGLWPLYGRFEHSRDWNLFRDRLQDEASERSAREATTSSIDLDRETVDLVVVSDPKDFSLLSLNAPIYVEGSFIDPAVSVGAEVVVPNIDFGDAGAGDGLCESLKENLD